jgi:hypothetical protein
MTISIACDTPNYTENFKVKYRPDFAVQILKPSRTDCEQGTAGGNKPTC